MNHSTGTPYMIEVESLLHLDTHWHGRKEKQTFHQEHYNETNKHLIIKLLVKKIIHSYLIIRLL